MEEVKTEAQGVTQTDLCQKDGSGTCGCKKACGVGGTCKRDSAVWTLSGAILLGSLMVAASILTSSSRTGSMALAPTGNQGAQNAPTAQQPAGDKKATVSLDDDAVLGNKSKAKVAIVEFSDYECPFCQKFHKETYKDLVKEFVDSGKAVYSFRDYPLPFHEPMASKAANLAQCVREAKGDQSFFAFNDAYFAATQTNAKGLPEGKQDEILKSLGVNVASVTQCATSEKFKDEIAKDMSDGSAAGVSGTPSFVIGKLDSKGNVVGELAVGAMPLAALKTTIEKYLAQ